MRRQLPGTNGRPIFLTGCRPSKFSLHVIMPGLVLDRNTISCRYLAWEFARFMWREIGLTFMVKTGTAKLVMARFMMIHKQASAHAGWAGTSDTPVDESIYSRNRNFRLLGNCKPGTPPLRIIESHLTFLMVPSGYGK
jgi:hypothetical protein